MRQTVKDTFDSTFLGADERICVGNIKRIPILPITNPTNLANWMRSKSQFDRFEYFRIKYLSELPSGTIIHTAGVEMISYIRTQACPVKKVDHKIMAVKYFCQNYISEGFLEIERAHRLSQQQF